MPSPTNKNLLQMEEVGESTPKRTNDCIDNSLIATPTPQLNLQRLECPSDMPSSPLKRKNRLGTRELVLEPTIASENTSHSFLEDLNQCFSQRSQNTLVCLKKAIDFFSTNFENDVLELVGFDCLASFVHDLGLFLQDCTVNCMRREAENSSDSWKEDETDIYVSLNSTMLYLIIISNLHVPPNIRNEETISHLLGILKYCIRIDEESSVLIKVRELICQIFPFMSSLLLLENIQEEHLFNIITVLFECFKLKELAMLDRLMIESISVLRIIYQKFPLTRSAILSEFRMSLSFEKLKSFKGFKTLCEKRPFNIFTMLLLRLSQSCMKSCSEEEEKSNKQAKNHVDVLISFVSMLISAIVESKEKDKDRLNDSKENVDAIFHDLINIYPSVEWPIASDFLFVFSKLLVNF